MTWTSERPPKGGLPVSRAHTARCPGIEIAAAGDLLAVGLLRGHVVGRAQHAAFGRDAGAAIELGDAKVGELDVVLGVDQQVRRLEVAMDDAAVVGVLERLGDRDADAGDFAPD